MVILWFIAVNILYISPLSHQIAANVRKEFMISIKTCKTENVYKNTVSILYTHGLQQLWTGIWSVEHVCKDTDSSDMDNVTL